MKSQVLLGSIVGYGRVVCLKQIRECDDGGWVGNGGRIWTWSGGRCVDNSLRLLKGRGLDIEISFTETSEGMVVYLD